MPDQTRGRPDSSLPLGLLKVARDDADGLIQFGGHFHQLQPESLKDVHVVPGVVFNSFPYRMLHPLCVHGTYHTLTQRGGCCTENMDLLQVPLKQWRNSKNVSPLFIKAFCDRHAPLVFHIASEAKDRLLPVHKRRQQQHAYASRLIRSVQATPTAFSESKPQCDEHCSDRPDCRGPSSCVRAGELGEGSEAERSTRTHGDRNRRKHDRTHEEMPNSFQSCHAAPLQVIGRNSATETAHG